MLRNAPDCWRPSASRWPPRSRAARRPGLRPTQPPTPPSTWPPAAATRASAIGTCAVWIDGATAGFKCRGQNQLDYATVAFCKDGTAQSGPTWLFTEPQWSYAYCSGDGNIAYALPEFV